MPSTRTRLVAIVLVMVVVATVGLAVALDQQSQSTPEADPSTTDAPATESLWTPAATSANGSMTVSWDVAESATVNLHHDGTIVEEYRVSGNDSKTIPIGEHTPEVRLTLERDEILLDEETVGVEPHEFSLDVPDEVVASDGLVIEWEAPAEAQLLVETGFEEEIEELPVYRTVNGTGTEHVQIDRRTTHFVSLWADNESLMESVAVSTGGIEADVIENHRERFVGVEAGETVPITYRLDNTATVPLEYDFELYADGELVEQYTSTVTPDDGTVTRERTVETDASHEPLLNLTTVIDGESSTMYVPVLYDRTGDGLYTWYEQSGIVGGDIEAQKESVGCSVTDLEDADSPIPCSGLQPADIEDRQDLPNASLDQKDLYVDVWHDEDAEPLTDEEFETVQQYFAEMPVENPDGTTGINLHVADVRTVPVGSILYGENETSELRERFDLRPHTYDLFLTEVDGANGFGRLGGNISVVDHEVDHRTFTITHEFLHNIVGQIEPDRHREYRVSPDEHPATHAVEGFLSVNPEERYLPQDIGEQIAEYGFEGRPRLGP